MPKEEIKIQKEIHAESKNLSETLGRIELKMLNLQKALLGDVSALGSKELPEELKTGLLQRVKYDTSLNLTEAVRIEKVIDETLCQIEGDMK